MSEKCALCDVVRPDLPELIWHHWWCHYEPYWGNIQGDCLDTCMICNERCNTRTGLAAHYLTEHGPGSFQKATVLHELGNV